MNTDLNITDKETMIRLLNSYYSDGSNPLKDLVPEKIIDNMISILRTRDGIFYSPGMKRSEYDPKNYTIIAFKSLEHLNHCEEMWNATIEMLVNQFKIYARDIPSISKEIKERIFDNVNGSKKESDQLRKRLNEIHDVKKEICEILEIPKSTSWEALVDSIRLLSEIT